jgi:hypothetical protein
MSAPATGGKFHLSYDADEDRLLVAVDAAGDKRYAMALTRRLAKLMIGALTEMQAKHRVGVVGANPLVRDTVLSFEHAQAVAEGVSSGDTRLNQPPRAFVAAPRLIREIKLTPQPDGGVILLLDDKQQTLTIDLNRQRAHSFLQGVLDQAGRAAWDLPVTAPWLERTAGDLSAATPRVVH